jgi:hypothetical protein
VDTVLLISVVVAGAFSLAAILYVVWPLLQPGSAHQLVDDERLTDLLVRKDTILRSIKELAFDYQMGKMSEEDYQRFDARLRRQAIGLMQQIEKIAPESAGLDAALEVEIARLRQQPDAEPVQLKHDEPAPVAALPVLPSPASQTISAQKPKRFCTECGAPIASTYKFCAECGAGVSMMEQPAQQSG